MEFWGVEVKPGVPFKVTPEENKLVHISQAALGEVKNNKGAENVPLRMKIDGSDFILGTLSAVIRPQIGFDLVFEREFVLSHDWKDGSVFLCGYTAENPCGLVFSTEEEEFDDEISSDDEEDIPMALENGKVEDKVSKGKTAKSAPTTVKPESSKKPVPPIDPKEDSDSDDDDEDEDESDDAAGLEFADMSEDEDSDDESESDEETPKKPVSNKKRPSEAVLKTPVSTKKAKAETPQKTDGKKNGPHSATPHPSKKAAEKTPASKNKGKEQQSPKSASNVKCGSCAKTFNSEGGRDAHMKAKHSAAK